MENLNIENPEHRDSIKEVLSQGIKSEFWKLICQRLQISIDSIQSQLDSDDRESLIAEEYKIRTEVLRKQKIDRLDILTIPEDLVQELDNPDFFVKKRDEEVY
jgi:predicted flavoprotein YhiN